LVNVGVVGVYADQAVIFRESPEAGTLSASPAQMHEIEAVLSYLFQQLSQGESSHFIQALL
jgi:hypothetical protein